MVDGCMRRRVGIVGGGASGALVAARLLRDAALAIEVVVFEPRERLGEGVAYSTTDPLHLLNVPACGMSALPEDPDHFVGWARCAPTDFVPRSRYADYLAELLSTSLAEAPAGSELVHVRERVIDVRTLGRNRVVTGTGRLFEFDAIVLATGNLAPSVPAPLRHLPSDVLVSDPWVPSALDDLSPFDEVLVVGTGLTMVDVSMTVLNSVRGARIHGVSRHGLVPLSHENPWRPRHEAPSVGAITGTAGLRSVIDYLRGWGEDWRRGLDSLRPVTQEVWQAMDDTTREAFVHRLSRFWDVHRHRMAPAIGVRFMTLRNAGRIRLHEAGVVEAQATDNGRVTVLLTDGSMLVVDKVVVCTGPEGQLTADPLARAMAGHGTAACGPMGMGYLVDPASGAIIDAAGGTQARLVTIGPLRKGVLWETTAIPEIRVQAASVAAYVLALEPSRVPAKEESHVSAL